MTNHIYRITPKPDEMPGSSPRPSGPAFDADDYVGGLRNRHDGWTPNRQRAFLEALSTCGCVQDAAAIAGMSAQSAYVLRRRPEAAAFRAAWDGALLLARDLFVDTAMNRALNGVREEVNCGGELIERVRHDNRLLASMIARLDKKFAFVEGQYSAGIASGRAADDFDALLDAIETGDENAAAAIVTPPPEPEPPFRGLSDLIEEYDRRKEEEHADREDEETVERLTRQVMREVDPERAERIRESYAEWKRARLQPPEDLDDLDDLDELDDLDLDLDTDDDPSAGEDAAGADSDPTCP